MISMNRSSPLSLMEAFNKFDKTFSRYEASESQTEFKAEPSLNTVIERNIKSEQKAWEHSVCITYQNFLTPKDSETSLDEEALLKSYKLFKALTSVCEEYSDSDVFVQELKIASPVSLRERYLNGNAFVYLRYWFFREAKIEDYVPVILLDKNKKNYLDFVSRESYKESAIEKSIKQVIEKHFYGEQK